VNAKLITETTLRVNEIFYSLQGETSTVGLPTVFVRLTGCPLRCGYCDTEYAFYEGERRSLGNILSEVAAYSPRYVTVTGGEPLAQKSCLTLLERLCDSGYRVSLETSGAMPIQAVDRRVVVILDLKTPGSGEMSKNLYENIPCLKPVDEVKFVLCNRRDYEWARWCIDDLKLDGKVADILFSPSYEELSPTDLAGWILEDKLPVRLQLQLHKLLWSDARGR